MKTEHTYPANQLGNLSIDQLEMIADTPLELALIAKVQRMFTDKQVDDIANERIEVQLSKRKVDDLESFYETVSSEMSWIGAEPHDQALHQAVVADVRLGQACHELTQYLIDEKFITPNGDVYNVIKIGTAVVNQWSQLRD